MRCAFSAGRHSGCDGGYASTALAWVESNEGLARAKDYTYTGVQGTCESNATRYPSHATADSAAADSDCAGTKSAVNHAVQLVGYTQDREWKTRCTTCETA